MTRRPAPDPIRTTRLALTSVADALTTLRRLDDDDLRARFEAEFGIPSKGRSSQRLLRRLAWKLQAEHAGGLTPRALDRIAALEPMHRTPSPCPHPLNPSQPHRPIIPSQPPTPTHHPPPATPASPHPAPSSAAPSKAPPTKSSSDGMTSPGNPNVTHPSPPSPEPSPAAAGTATPSSTPPSPKPARPTDDTPRSHLRPQIHHRRPRQRLLIPRQPDRVMPRTHQSPRLDTHPHPLQRRRLQRRNHRTPCLPTPARRLHRSQTRCHRCAPPRPLQPQRRRLRPPPRRPQTPRHRRRQRHRCLRHIHRRWHTHAQHHHLDGTMGTEAASERLRAKFAATRRKGLFTGGTPPFGYGIQAKRLVIDPA